MNFLTTWILPFGLMFLMGHFLSRMMEGVVLERYVMDNTLWLVRAEVDVDCIPHDTILSYSNKEYVLKYAPQNGFQEWLSEIEGVMMPH